MTGKPVIPTLRIPTAPSFPLSSPITEEIPSPASSSSPPDEKGQHRPLEVSKTSRRTPFVHVPERTAHRSQMVETDEQSSSGVGIGAGAKRPVGLNLVTDFSSSSLSVPKVKKRSPTLVDLNDLKTLCRARERERSVQKIKGILKKRRSQGIRRVHVPDGSLETGRRAIFDMHSQETSHPNKKRKDELSPGDRPITIGLTVSYADSVDSDSNKGKSREREMDGIDNQTPVTPSIVVTPAGEDSFWEDDVPEQQQQQHQCQHPKPRVASSIYSQPTPNPMLDDEVPPVPAIPAYHSKAATATPAVTPSLQQRRSGIKTRKSRAYSTGTVFEEDDSPASARSQSSNQTRRKALSRLSINTDTNRHQSQGWWTYLLSPLLKSSSSSSAKTPTSPDRPPLLPGAANSTASSEDWWESESKEVSCFSPDTPETPGIDPVESGWQGLGTSTNPFVNGNMSREVGDTGAGMFAGQVIQGCAAEYYQACAHELFSGTPYFECVNHVCSITPVVAEPRVREEETRVGETAGVKGLVVVDKPEVQSPKPEARVQHFSGTAVNDNLDAPVVNTEPASTAKSKDNARNLKIETGNQPNKPEHLNPFLQPATTTARPATPVTPFCVPPVATSPPPPLPPTNTATTVTVERAVPHYIVVPQSQQPQAPDPVSPAFQQATERTGIPLSSLQNGPAPSTAPSAPSPAKPTGTNDTHANQWPHPLPTRGVSPVEREYTTTESQTHEKQTTNKADRGRGNCLGKCFGRNKKGKTKRRCYIAIACLFLMILVVAILFAVFLTHKVSSNSNSNKTTPVQLNWLNLTGYPPMPTGIATIAGPESRVQEPGCIYPETLWSCALPKEQQADNEPYDADEPNFLVQIRFRNGTYPRSTTPTSKRSTSWDPSPSPPSTQDQTFLGNTTDHNAKPYAGEEAPFFMTFLSPTPQSSSSKSDSGLARRSFFPNLTDIIPAPETESDGTAAAANLYPLPESQPIRLYNRGLDTEHYGFYTYFDRSIFLESSAPLNGKPVDTVPGDRNGGSKKENARVRCTWAQTRFLVQIWTRPDKLGRSLLQSRTSSSSSSTSTSAPASATATANSTSNSTADYTRPGTFPYPVTITLDRHGGTASQKMVYCYGMNDDQTLNATQLKLQVEERGYGGTLVNPAPGVFNNTNVVSSKEDGGWGGVDGVDGGCGCQWVNWGGLG